MHEVASKENKLTSCSWSSHTSQPWLNRAHFSSFFPFFFPSFLLKGRQTSLPFVLIRRRCHSYGDDRPLLSHSLRGSSPFTPPSVVFFFSGSKPNSDFKQTPCKVWQQQQQQKGSLPDLEHAQRSHTKSSNHKHKGATTTTTTLKAPGGVKRDDCRRIFESLAGGKSSKLELMLQHEG